MKYKKSMLILITVFSIFIIGCTSSNNELTYSDEMTLNTLSNPVSSLYQPIYGDDNAPVKMAYYYDYQCRWCKDFDINTLPELSKFVDEGTLQITLKDLVFLGPDSKKASLASECVFQKYGKEKFLQFHTSMYENQKTKNTGWVTDTLIENISSELSLDYNYIKECIISEKYIENLQKDTDEARFNGLTSTPSFIINDQKFSGSLPLSTFKQIIENGKTNKK